MIQTLIIYQILIIQLIGFFVIIDFQLKVTIFLHQYQISISIYWFFKSPSL